MEELEGNLEIERFLMYNDQNVPKSVIIDAYVKRDELMNLGKEHYFDVLKKMGYPVDFYLKRVLDVGYEIEEYLDNVYNNKENYDNLYFLMSLWKYPYEFYNRFSIDELNTMGF